MSKTTIKDKRKDGTTKLGNLSLGDKLELGDGKFYMVVDTNAGATNVDLVKLRNLRNGRWLSQPKTLDVTEMDVEIIVTDSK